jgi:ubiquinone/menaquinone biosynthesis C-methylase UbiE
MLKRSVAATIFAALVALAPVAWSQDNAADIERLVEALKLSPGSVVAEIGAGGGELSMGIAKRVAPGGRVISSELGASRVQGLRDAFAKGGGAANLEVIEGHETRTNLPDACCDAVFMRNVYHHFGDPPSMNASILRALKPGGRVAVIDFPPRGNGATAPPGKRGDNASHGVSAATVAAELGTAGFQIVKSEEQPSLSRWFIVVGAKPAS